MNPPNPLKHEVAKVYVNNKLAWAHAVGKGAVDPSDLYGWWKKLKRVKSNSLGHLRGGASPDIWRREPSKIILENGEGQCLGMWLPVWGTNESEVAEQ